MPLMNCSLRLLGTNSGAASYNNFIPQVLPSQLLNDTLTICREITEMAFTTYLLLIDRKPR